MLRVHSKLNIHLSTQDHEAKFNQLLVLAIVCVQGTGLMRSLVAAVLPRHADDEPRGTGSAEPSEPVRIVFRIW